MSLTAFTPAELTSLGVDVQKEALNDFVAAVNARLSGPSPEPVFIPSIGPHGQNYRGLLLVPHRGHKSALKA